VHDLAVKLASKDVSFAGSLAGVAREFAEGGSFTRALALHDVVMALPPLDTDLVEVASWAPKAASKRKAQVPAQAMWVCNATWAAQADNNKQPVDPARARAYLTQAAQFAPLNPPIFINLACIAFELADHDAAIRLVSQAAEHGCDTRTLAAEPLLAPLHTHPRWANALAGQA
jgi:hypothetical protein